VNTTQTQDQILKVLNGFNKSQFKSLKSVFDGRTIKYIQASRIDGVLVIFRNDMSFWFNVGPRGKIFMIRKEFINGYKPVKII